MPVDGCCYALLIASLQTINDSQYFARISANARRVQHCKPDLLVGIEDEDGADGERGVDLLHVLLRHHVIQISYTAVRIGDDWELEIGV